jgi:hypothetical protein
MLPQADRSPVIKGALGINNQALRIDFNEERKNCSQFGD